MAIDAVAQIAAWEARPDWKRKRDAEMPLG
jgi:hypothetical protein